MGKSKPRNRNKNRADPTSKQIKPPSDPELAAIREQRILPVLKDLQSLELKIRSAAARAITNLIEDKKTRKLLLREQIVRILLEQTLSDSSLETRTDGWGILRNLALEEESDFCIHLFRQDILTAIEGVFKTIIQTIESESAPLTKLPSAQRNLLWNLTNSILNLVSSLAEAQEEIVEVLSKISTIRNFLFGLLDLEATPDEVIHEVLSCLTSLTEDNKELDKQIVDNRDWMKSLIRIKDSNSINAVAACGVLHNVFVAMSWYDHNTPMDGASDAGLIPTLVQHMQISPQNNGTDGHTGNMTPDEVLQLALEITASIASSLQEALEHGNRYESEKEFEGFGDDPEPKDKVKDEDVMDADQENVDAREEEEGDGDEMTQEEIDADMELVLADGPDVEDEDTHIEGSTLDRLVRIAVPKLLFLSRTTSGTSDFQNHALAALNNIAWTVSTIDFSTGTLESLHTFWASLCQQIWNEIISPVLASNTADIELASSITSLAWAVARSVKGEIQINADEPSKFMALYQASKSLPGNDTQTNGTRKADSESDEFQGLGVKCIGVLGSLALEPAPIGLNRQIGIFLLTVLSTLSEAPPADTVEALNQLFDIYADRSYSFDEPVFWGDNFYKHLEDIQPKAKKLTKSIDKRMHNELRARADEAMLNLGRFLVYKRKEKKFAKDVDM